MGFVPGGVGTQRACFVGSDTVAVLAVLPRYWGRNTRDNRGDGDQSCGTTAVMELSFSHVHEN